jgi:hypothetical protein
MITQVGGTGNHVGHARRGDGERDGKGTLIVLSFDRVNCEQVINLF